MTQTRMCWGIECGDGWYDILDEMCLFIDHARLRLTHCILDQETGQDLEPPPEKRVFEFSQIKEKCGTLRVYYTTNSKTCEDVASVMTAWATWKSGQTCEECGAPGRMNGGPWYRVRCKKHERG